MEAKSNRGAWIVAIAILLAAAGIVGYLVWERSAGLSCDEWQARASDMKEAAGDGLYTTPLEDDPLYQSHVENIGERPEGCPIP